LEIKRKFHYQKAQRRFPKSAPAVRYVEAREAPADSRILNYESTALKPHTQAQEESLLVIYYEAIVQ